ncbi:S8 family serine peptidase [Alphaproteobacteria bacterium]|nr:S8 family serine peptidase [Alphaproteobacteria bacterium]
MLKVNLNFFCLCFSSLLLFSCGGGGGSSSSTTISYVTSEYNNQYGLGNIKASAAYDRGYNGNGIKVAVLDGGFDTSHTDLDENFITGYDEEDDDNTPNAESHTAAMGGHGTHVAGIIAAEKNDSGMHGVAYNASIMPIKIFQDSGTFVSEISNSVAYAADNGAIVLNNSWGSSTWTSAASCGGTTCYGHIPNDSSSAGFNSANERTEWDDVATANAVAVFAAGNQGNNSATGAMNFYASRSTSSTFINSYTSQVVKNAGLIDYTNRSTYEARFGLVDSDISENWINVVAVDSNNTIASFSNGCGDTKAYCIAAPGTDIYSTLPTDLDSDGFAEKDGTSMAAPHVAAAVAVLKHEYPNLTGAEIVDLLLDNATDLGDSGTDDVYGVGLLNLDAATSPSGVLVVAQTDQDNNLGKLDLSSSSINFNSLFKSKLITSDNFLGVVDDYNRVYSVGLNDFVSYQSSNSLINKLLMKKKGKKKNINAIDKFNTVSYVQNDDEGLLNFDTLSYTSYDIPYIKIFEGDQGFINYQNKKMKSNFIVFDEHVTNGNFILYTNFKKKMNKANTNLNIGLINEGKTFLGTSGKELFESKSNTFFIHNNNNMQLNSNHDIIFKFAAGQTFVDFEYDTYVKDTAITTGEYILGLASETKDYNLKNFIGIMHPLSIVDGSLELDTISGYDQNGDYRNRKQEIDLSSSNNLNMIWNVDKFFDNNSLVSVNTSFSDNNSSVTVVYAFKF